MSEASKGVVLRVVEGWSCALNLHKGPLTEGTCAGKSPVL